MTEPKKINENIKNQENDTYFYIGTDFRIRETRDSDLPVWYKWFNDPDITRELMHGVVPNTIEQQAKFRLSNIDGREKILFTIIASESPEIIGTCSINIHGSMHHGHAEISIVLGNKEYQKGSIYLQVTKWQLNHAFFMMNMNSVFSVTSSSNKVVVETLKRLGFSEIGVIRQCTYHDGRYHDDIMQDILKSEWLEKNYAK